jgi:hypothetical protein
MSGAELATAQTGGNNASEFVSCRCIKPIVQAETRLTLTSSGSQTLPVLHHHSTDTMVDNG